MVQESSFYKNWTPGKFPTMEHAYVLLHVYCVWNQECISDGIYFDTLLGEAGELCIT